MTETVGVRRAVYRALPVMLLVATLLLAACAANAQQRARVVEPYIELHTGPGRHYPIFHVEPRGQWIDVLKRKTDWFLVIAGDGKRGWVSREQLQKTLNEAGQPRRFRDVVMDDYLRRRLEVGLAGGDMEGQTVMTLRANYRLADTLGTELALSQISGAFNSSRVYSAHVLAQPFHRWRVAPFASLGIGRFSDAPRKTLVDAEASNSTAAILGVGMRVYLTERFILRGDYRNYLILVSDENSREFDEFTVGVSFFF